MAEAVPPLPPDLDPYEVLQVHPRAGAAMIKKAYRTLLLESGAHPDQGGSAATLQLLNEAYRTLSDPERRRAYDAARAAIGVDHVVYLALCPACGSPNRVRPAALTAARCGRCRASFAPPPAPPSEGAEGAVDARVPSWKWWWPAGRRPLGGHGRWRRLVGRLLVVGALGAFTTAGLAGEAVLAHHAASHAALASASHLGQQGRLAAAAGVYRSVLLVRPGSGQAHQRLGRVLEQQQQLDEAAEEYRTAAALMPGDAYPVFLLGRTLAHLGRIPEAEAALRHSLSLDPGDDEALVALGELLVRSGRADQALAYLQRAQAVGAAPERRQAAADLAALDRPGN